MINLLKSLGLAILTSLPMLFAAGTAEGNLAELDEEVFGPRPDKHSLTRSTLPDITTALECLSCTAHKKEFSAAKVELLMLINAIELTEPSAIAIRAMLKKGVEDIYADSEERDYGDTCMLALAGSFERSNPTEDIQADVVLKIAETLRSLRFMPEEFTAAKDELLLKWIAPEVAQEASKIIWGILRDSIDAI
jgi:hypothetical protein